MSLGLDIVILVIILVTVIGGVKKGFISAIFDFAKLIASVLLAISFKGQLALYIAATEPFKNIKQSALEGVKNAFTNAGENIAAADILASFKEQNPALADAIEGLGGNLDGLGAYLEGAGAQQLENGAEAAAAYIVEPCASAVATILAFIVIFVVALIALTLVQKLLNLVFELPVLRQINKTGGLIVGVICAYLYVSLFVTVMGFIFETGPAIGINLPVDAQQETYLYSFFMEYNVFEFLRELFTKNTIV